jgi:hypothetical protein
MRTSTSIVSMLCISLACTPPDDAPGSSSQTDLTAPWHTDTDASPGKDTSIPDSGGSGTDSSTGDSGSKDSGSGDTSTEDTSSKDTSSEDTATEDTGTEDTGTEPPCKIDCDGDGWTTEDGDCDDDESTAYPGADEICGDWVDNDCDGTHDNQEWDPKATDAYTLSVHVSSSCEYDHSFSWSSSCDHSEAVTLSLTEDFSVSMDCELDDVPDLGELIIGGAVDEHGEITMSLDYVEGEMSATSKGTMCDGKSYQDGDHEVWGSLPMFAIDEYICLVIWRTQVEAL